MEVAVFVHVDSVIWLSGSCAVSGLAVVTISS